MKESDMQTQTGTDRTMWEGEGGFSNERFITVTYMFISSINILYRYDPSHEPMYTGWSSVHWNATGMTLDPVYTGIPLGDQAHTCRVHWNTTGKTWNSPTLECHWRNLVETAPHWDTTGETLTFIACTRTPLERLWQPTHAPTHIVKHAEYHPCQFEMTRWRDTSKQIDRSLYIQPLLGVYCSAMDTSSALNTCEYFNITLCMPLISTPLWFFVYLGLQVKWNQLSSNNSQHTSCIYIGSHAGKWPNLMTSKPDSASTQGYHWTNHTGRPLEPQVHWDATGNHTGWC